MLEVSDEPGVSGKLALLWCADLSFRDGRFLRLTWQEACMHSSTQRYTHMHTHTSARARTHTHTHTQEITEARPSPGSYPVGIRDASLASYNTHTHTRTHTHAHTHTHTQMYRVRGLMPSAIESRPCPWCERTWLRRRTEGRVFVAALDAAAGMPECLCDV